MFSKDFKFKCVLFGTVQIQRNVSNTYFFLSKRRKSDFVYPFDTAAKKDPCRKNFKLNWEFEGQRTDFLASKLSTCCADLNWRVGSKNLANGSLRDFHISPLTKWALKIKIGHQRHLLMAWSHLQSILVEVECLGAINFGLILRIWYKAIVNQNEGCSCSTVENNTPCSTQRLGSCWVFSLLFLSSASLQRVSTLLISLQSHANFT